MPEIPIIVIVDDDAAVRRAIQVKRGLHEIELSQRRRGVAAALNRLTPILYEQLRRLARRHVVGQRRGDTRFSRSIAF